MLSAIQAAFREGRCFCIALFGGFYVKKISVYVHISKGKIVCMCLQSNKKCGRWCEKDEVLYDEYRGWQECFKNKGPKPML